VPEPLLLRPGRPFREVNGGSSTGSGGGCAPSPEVFALLAAVDGTSTVAMLAGELTEAMRAESVSLWQRRFFVLTPRAPPAGGG
jgi:hypothetical protein